MNTTPSSTPHPASTTASDPPADHDRRRSTPPAGAAGERALVLGGGGSTGNAWLIGVIAGLFDAGLDVTTADLTIGTSAGSTAAAQLAGATPTELLAAILAAAPRNGPVRSDPAADALRPGRWRTTWRGRARSSPPPRMRPTCAAGWARRRSTWMRRRTAPGRHSGAPPSPRGCPVSAGRNERCSSRRSMPRPVNRSCSTATAESTWWTPSPPAVPVAFPTGSGTAGTSTAATDPTPRMPIWQPDTHGCWCCHRSAAEHWTPPEWGTHLATQVDELRAGGSRVETIFPDSDAEHMFGANAMDPSLRPPAARAGYDQGRALAEQLTEFWR